MVDGVIVILGAVGWGLIIIGGAWHIIDHTRLRTLLSMHLDRERPLAIAVTATEVVLGIALPVGLLTHAVWLRPAALAAVVLGLGFAGWIARLLLAGSDLPCACSFSSAPTSGWSLFRAVLVCTAGVWAIAVDVETFDTIAAMTSGLALAAAVYVVPEAMSWPAAARAQLARLDSHGPSAEPVK